jgi:hypothetical protein
MNWWKSRFAISGLLVTNSIALTSEARAQSSVTLVPSVSISSINDGNLVDRQGSGDQMLWLTPRLEGQVTTPAATLMGSYAFDMQRVFDSPSLNEIEARRQALFDGVFRGNEKTSLTVDGRYDFTDAADQLIFGTGLLLEHRPAWRWSLGPLISYQASALTAISAQYHWTSEGIEGNPNQSEGVVRAGIAQRLSPRTTASAVYLERRFTNDTDVRSSQAVMAGWAYRFGPFSTLSVQGGPRLSARGELVPEISAAFTRKVGDLTAIALDYWRGESITLGVDGPVEVNSATAKAARPVYRQIQLGLFGGFFNSTTISQGRARVYHGNVVAAWTPSRPLVVSVSYGADVQRGDVRTMLLSDKRFGRNVFIVRLTIASRLTRSLHMEDPLQPLGQPSSGANQ